MKLKILLLALLAINTLAFSTYKKFTVDDPDALCLDGTKPVYYIKEGDLQKWVINFEGGGWCGSPLGLSQTIEDCYQRSKTDLGSSKNYVESWNYWDGMFGDNPDNFFKDWTIVYFKYCTGTGHQGYRKEPVQYKDTNLYFRGHNATMGMMKSLVQKNSFNNVEEIVITGQSAGGLATYLWTEYIVEFAQKLIVFHLWSIPDSGIFLDQMNRRTNNNDYKQIFLNFMQLSNTQVDPPNTACVKDNPTEKWKCMFAEYNYKYIKIPLFAVQSPYDTWCLPNILGLYCQKSGSLAECEKQGVLDIIEDYHQNTSKVLRQIGKNPKNGYWAPSCANHCYSNVGSFYNSNYRIPAKSENSLSKSIADWINNVPVNHNHQDSGNWPSNAPCSGVSLNDYNLIVQ